MSTAGQQEERACGSEHGADADGLLVASMRGQRQEGGGEGSGVPEPCGRRAPEPAPPRRCSHSRLAFAAGRPPLPPPPPPPPLLSPPQPLQQHQR